MERFSPGNGDAAVLAIRLTKAAGFTLAEEILPVGAEAESAQVRRPAPELSETAGGSSAIHTAVEARAARVAHPAERFRGAHRAAAAHGEVSLAFIFSANTKDRFRVHVPPRRKRPHFHFAAQLRVDLPRAA